MTAKIWLYNPNNLVETINETDVHPKETDKRVLVGGCFDVLHFGHIKFLQAAKALGNRLLVALEPDEKILENKKRRPIHTQLQRAEILSHLRFVDEIILLPCMTSYEEYLNFVQFIKPQYLAVTAGDSQLNNKQKQACVIGAKLVEVTDAIPSFSSSHLIKEKDWI